MECREREGELRVGMGECRERERRGMDGGDGRVQREEWRVRIWTEIESIPHVQLFLAQTVGP